jgi:hypothetical protein
VKFEISNLNFVVVVGLKLLQIRIRYRSRKPGRPTYGAKKEIK